MPVVGPRALKFIGPLNAAMQEFGIDTPERKRMFLAQVAHESNQFKSMAENLNYSPFGLVSTFNTKTNIRFSPAQAQAFGRTVAHPANQQMIADIAYANRMGNGDVQSGDGWKYRGRGIIQLTGRTNYVACMMGTGIDCVQFPDLLEQPAEACRAAAWFWKSNGLNELADKGDFHRITKIINGGYNGMDDRLAFYAQASKVIV